MSRDIRLDLIDPDADQPRKHFDPDSLAELAASLASVGLASPILVRPVDDRFVIVHGERRWRAAASLGWTTVSAVVRDIDPDEARWLQLAENVARADLTPIEEARAYQARLAEGVTQAELGARIGKSQSYVAQKLRLLTLPSPIAAFLEHGALSEGHARQLLRMRGYLERNGEEATVKLNPEAVAYLASDKPGPGERAFVLHVHLRPLDQPACYPFLNPTWELKPAVLAATAECARWLAEVDGQVPSWACCAFWYAMQAAVLDVSVALLTKVIDAWVLMLDAALIDCFLRYVNILPHIPRRRGVPREPASFPVTEDFLNDEGVLTVRREMALMESRGYWADLKHAGALGWARDVVRSATATEGDGPIDRAMRNVLQVPGDGVPLPSNMQKNGWYSEKYDRLADRLEGEPHDCILPWGDDGEGDE
jgi:ParB/RepB/Spo0J family partition protein